MISFQGHVRPMLGVLSEPFSSPTHSFEIKWDGYRAIAFLDPQGGVRLESRNLKPLLPRFPTLGSLHKQMKKQAILDGEIVSFVDGKPSFTALAQGKGDIVYLAFDLLWLEGDELMAKPLWRRQEILEAEGQKLNLSLPLATDGLSAIGRAEELGLEGIMAKERASFYLPGKRSRAWQKFKVRKKGAVVLGGYKLEKGLAILMGAWEGDRLRYLGKVGTGFAGEEEQKLLTLFSKLKIDECPFQPQLPPQGCTWLKPVLTGKIQYLELTEKGQLRHASWLNLCEKSEPCLWEEF